jgi:predicted dehydrogenase
MTRVGIIGLGSIGSKHVDALLSLGYDNLMAYDIHPNAAEPRLPVVEMFEALLDWHPEYAIVASPPDLHYNHARQLLAEGCAVLVEKPLCMNSRDALQLCIAAREQNKTLAVGYMERAHPKVQKVKKTLSWEGVPSEAIILLRWQATRKSYPWVGTVYESSHALDLALWYFGEVDRVKVNLKDDHRLSAELYHRIGTHTHVIIDSQREPRRSIVLGYGEQNLVTDYGQTREEWLPCYEAELRAFLEDQPLCTGVDGAAVIQLIERLDA